MAMQWPVGKLDLINSALAQTGNNLVAVLEDGSDEYNVCSPSYERGLGLLMEDYNWGFATQVVTLTPSPTAPPNTAWDTQFPLPADLLHVIWVRINQNQGDPVAQVLPQPVLYDIEGGMLVLNAQGGPPPPAPTTPGIVTLKYLSATEADPVNGTPLFVVALQCFVMSGIYRGLHGDIGEALRMWQAGEVYAQRSRTRYDQQKPKRQLWSSRIAASRRIRRPWPPMGNDDWGGTGIPS